MACSAGGKAKRRVVSRLVHDGDEGNTPWFGFCSSFSIYSLSYPSSDEGAPETGQLPTYSPLKAKIKSIVMSALLGINQPFPNSVAE